MQSELEQLADTVDEEREKLGDAAEEVEDVSDIAAAVTTLGSSITLLGTAIEEALGAIEAADTAGELETAFEESEACDEIRSWRASRRSVTPPGAGAPGGSRPSPRRRQTQRA